MKTLSQEEIDDLLDVGESDAVFGDVNISIKHIEIIEIERIIRLLKGSFVSSVEIKNIQLE